MRRIGLLLGGVGGHGPILLVASLVLGAFVPSAAQAGYAALPFSAFLLTLGSFLAASMSPLESRARPLLLVGVLVWVGAVIPVGGAMILSGVSLDPSIKAGMLISVLAPPVGSAAAIAAMLGLQPRLALVASIALTVLVPFTMPLFASLAGLGASIDVSALAIRLFVIIGLAALISSLASRFRDFVRPVLPDTNAAAGLAVIGLIIVGLATSRGVRAHWVEHPVEFERMLAAAIALNFGLCVLGMLVFSWLDFRAAATIGLVSGNRNVTLAWAATGAGLPPLAEGYLAACVIPVLALPLIIKICVALATHWLRFVATMRLRALSRGSPAKT